MSEILVIHVLLLSLLFVLVSSSNNDITKYQHNKIYFSVSLSNVAGSAISVIEGEDKSDQTIKQYKLEIKEREIASVTEGCLKTAEDLNKHLTYAFLKKGNYTVEDFSLNDEALMLKIHHDLKCQTKAFYLPLIIYESIDAKILKILKLMQNASDDQFSTNSRHHHEDLKTFHKNLGIVKFQGGKDYTVATTGVLYNQGVHYVEFKIIRASSPNMGFGIQPHLNLGMYPGKNNNKSGKSLFHNGYVYHDDTNTWYSQGTFTSGDYVGVLLNMNQKKVSFSINGRLGEALNVNDQSNYISVTFYNEGDAVEIVTQESWHK